MLCPARAANALVKGELEKISEKKLKGLPDPVQLYDDIIAEGGRVILCELALENKDIKVENVYSRVVNWEGNPRAQKMVYEIFEPCDTDWRGLGVIPGSGLKIRDQYQDFDAQVRLEIELPEVEEAKGCMCGQILKGINTPQDCPLYAKRCTPANPIGPCMVSSEGTCAAYFKYGQD